MKRFGSKLTAALAIGITAFALSACSSDQVIDNTVDVVGGGTKIVAKGVVGTGKLVYRGIAGDGED
ncbi:MAG: hypothetical protein ACU0GG_12595 [Paracoccaceae bacterium]